MFVTVPRLFNKFHDLIKLGMAAAKGIKGSIAARAVKVKTEALRSSGQYSDWLYDKLVFNKIKMILGGNVKIMVTGSAPISSEVLDFLKICFCCPILEGYGQTEGCGAEFVQNYDDHSSGNVGGVLKTIEFKLVDVPEMKYTSEDTNEEGKPTPRGEIWVRGAGVISGYFKNQEKTDETITNDGFLKSGDIGMIMPETRALKIVDRVKNIFKLNCGEYVAPDRLEQIYKTAMGVDDVFVYGESVKNSLIAIVVPNIAGLKAYGCNPGLESFDKDTPIADINNKEIITSVMKSLNEVADLAKLKGFEKIGKVHCVNVQFADNDLCTSTFKLKRNVAKEFF